MLYSSSLGVNFFDFFYIVLVLLTCLKCGMCHRAYCTVSANVPSCDNLCIGNVININIWWLTLDLFPYINIADKGYKRSLGVA